MLSSERGREGLEKATNHHLLTPSHISERLSTADQMMFTVHSSYWPQTVCHLMKLIHFILFTLCYVTVTEWNFDNFAIKRQDQTAGVYGVFCRKKTLQQCQGTQHRAWEHVSERRAQLDAVESCSISFHSWGHRQGWVKKHRKNITPAERSIITSQSMKTVFNDKNTQNCDTEVHMKVLWLCNCPGS